MKNKILLSSVVATVVLSLSGCGGGGSSTPPPDKTAKLTGIAVDDLILNGIVRVTDDANKTLATGMTSKTDGSYTIDVPYKGVVVVNVSCDDNSTMLNPDTNKRMSCPEDVSLHSVATIEAVDTPIKVNISPLTEVAYNKAVKNGLTEKAVEEANAQVAFAFSVNPLSASPIDDDTYSATIDAIHSVAEDTNKSIMDVTNSLSDAFKGSEVSNEGAVSALVEALKDNNVSSMLVENNGTMDLPENIAPLSELEAAKAFTKELRTQANEIETFMNDESAKIDKALNSTVIDLNFASMVLDHITTTIGDMVEDGETESNTDINDKRSLTIKGSEGKYSYDIEQGDTVWRGDITFPAAIAGDEAEAEIYKEQTLSITIKGALPCDKEDASHTQNLDLKLTSTRKGDITKLKFVGKVDSGADAYEVLDADVDLAYRAPTSEDEDPIFDYVKVNTLNLEGIVGGYTIDGKLDINEYVQNDKMKADGGIIEEEEGGFNGQISCSHSSVKDASVTFTYDGKTYSPDYSNISYEYNFDFYEVPANLEHDEIEHYLTWNATCEDSDDKPSLSIHGSWGDDEEEINNSGWLPSDATFTGSIMKSSDTYLNGVLNVKWLNVKTIDLDSSEDPVLQTTLNGKLKTSSDNPELLVNLSVDTDKKSLTADYTYGETVINLTASQTTNDSNVTTNIFQVTNQIGDVLDINETNGDATGALTKDGKTLGTVENRDDAVIIKYYDGSFESIF